MSIEEQGINVYGFQRNGTKINFGSTASNVGIDDMNS